ncbi:MAG TPA: hypothetical protein VHF67_07520 [Gaiellaceae bacterium]|nr:hypothetical protein [Gaiellaceae bacterium]
MAQVVNEPRRLLRERARDAGVDAAKRFPGELVGPSWKTGGETAAYTTILNDGRRNGGLIEVAAEMGSDA